MKNVTIVNASTTPIGLPGQRLLEPGGFLSVTAEYAEKMQSRPVVAAWFENGTLTLGELPFGSAEENEGETLTTKDATVELLAGYGITRSTRTSLKKLHALLAKASAAEAEQEGIADEKSKLVKSLQDIDYAVSPDMSVDGMRSLLKRAVGKG